MKKLMITGATGFLGSRIAGFYEGKYEILTPGHGEMDITDKAGVDDYITANRPDFVVHCAAVSDVGRCGEEPEKSRRINVTGSENIARACAKNGVKCVLCSSDQVYFASPEKGPHTEMEASEPGNEYGRQKLFMEKSCLEINPDSVLLRLTWMYDSESRNEQEHGDFMRTLLANMKADAELFFPVYDVRGITDVQQIIANLEKVFELPGGVYNYGSAGTGSTFETMRRVFGRLGLDIGKIHENEDAFREEPRDISMDTGKINTFGILFPDTEEGIYEVLKKKLL